MLKVLSLFDGIATGRLALEMAGIDVGLYFASEVDKDVKAVARANWPDMIHLGPVETITATDLPDIDLVIGGARAKASREQAVSSISTTHAVAYFLTTPEYSTRS